MDEQVIVIRNPVLANYVMFKLDKIENAFTKSELAQITELVIEGNAYLEELSLFNNIRDLTITNACLVEEFMMLLSHISTLESLTFRDCEFENADLLAEIPLRSLSLIACPLNSYNFVYQNLKLEELTIIQGQVCLANINKLTNLRYLQLSYSHVIDFPTSLNLPLLKELYIDNTNVDNLAYINNLNLSCLRIDAKQYNANRALVDALIQKAVLVVDENMTAWGGD